MRNCELLHGFKSKKMRCECAKCVSESKLYRRNIFYFSMAYPHKGNRVCYFIFLVWLHGMNKQKIRKFAFDVQKKKQNMKQSKWLSSFADGTFIVANAISMRCSSESLHTRWNENIRRLEKNKENRREKKPPNGKAEKKVCDSAFLCFGRIWNI